MTRCVCVFLALALAAPAMANVPYPDLCILTNAAGSDGAVVYVLPNGTGATFDNANLPAGMIDATLTLTVNNIYGDPIENVPPEDMWIVTTGGGLVACSAIHPDGPTDVNGQTTWVSSPFAGGNSLAEDVQAVIAGMAVPGTVPVHFVSADMNGDLLVNLADIAEFSPAIGSSTAEADFNADGAVNLTDIAEISQALGATCP